MDKERYNLSVVDMFFKELVPQFEKRELIINGYVYNVGFNLKVKDKENNSVYETDLSSKDDNVPTLYVQDFNSFSKKLMEYADEVDSKDLVWLNPLSESTKEERLKYNLGLVWANATWEDFNNPEELLDRYIGFINDETFSEYDEGIDFGEIEELKGAHLNIKRTEQDGNFETPYILEFALTKKYDEERNLEYKLPIVRYGVCEDAEGNKEAYIYAVQGERRRSKGIKEVYEDSDEEYHIHNEKFARKIERELYRINKEVREQESDEYKKYRENPETEAECGYPQNISDVSVSTILSLSTAIALMQKGGINKVKAPGYMPIRWQAKYQAINKRLALMKKRGIDQNEIEKIENEERAKHAMIQKNLTNKFIRSFKNVEFQFNNAQVSKSPYEGSSFLEINLDDEKNHDISDNAILKNVTNKIFENERPTMRENKAKEEEKDTMEL